MLHICGYFGTKSELKGFKTSETPNILCRTP